MDSSPPKKDSQPFCPKPEKSSSRQGEESLLPPPSPPGGGAAPVSKAPGWRLSSSSMLKLKQNRPRSTEDSLGLGLTSNIRSETSISSNGPLRSWFVNEKEQQKQLTPAMAKLSAELAKQYKYGSSPTEKSPKHLGEENSTSSGGGGSSGGGRRAILHCPVDPITGGYNDDLDLQQYKMILIEDNSEEEEGGAGTGTGAGPNEMSLRSGKSLHSGKEKTTLRQVVVTKAPLPPPKATSTPPAATASPADIPKKSPPGTSPM